MSTQLEDQSRSQSLRYPCPAGNEIAQRLAQYVHFMRNHSGTQAPFALFLSIEETESKPFTSKFLLCFQNQLAKIKRQEQYKTLTYKDDKLQQYIYRKTATGDYNIV